MKIDNIKLDRATNSSSTHFIIMTEKKLKEYLPCEANEYGWENFILVSPESKKDYLATILYMNLQGKMDEKLALFTANSYLNTDISKEAYIDHQSHIHLPPTRGGHQINLDFFDDLCKYVLQDKVIIVGGNDNSPRNPLVSEAAAVFDDDDDDDVEMSIFYFLRYLFAENSVARKDGSYWTLFNKESGRRATFSFETTEPLQVAQAPMLVELSITDKCFKDCPWCYRGSTALGKDANPETVINIGHNLSLLGVFEVCFGGGEPVEHPGLPYFISTYNEYYGINVNFTTRNLDWSDELLSVVKANNVGVGVSVDTEEEVHKVIERFSEWNLVPNLTLHIVDRLMPKEVFKKILKEREIQWYPHLLVLGYKKMERGATYSKLYPSLWPLIVKELEVGPGALSIDTILAAQNYRELEKLDIPSYLYQTKEGRNNCFIDAVNGYMARSSYECEEKDIIRFSLNRAYNSQEFSDLWARLPR